MSQGIYCAAFTNSYWAENYLIIYFVTQGVAFVEIIADQLPVTTHMLVILFPSPWDASEWVMSAMEEESTPEG